MKEFFYRLIESPSSSLTVVWIDDMFRTDADEPPTSRLPINELPLTRIFLESYLTLLRLNRTALEKQLRQPTALTRIHELYEACLQSNVNLAFANFEWAEINVNVGVPDKMALLVDVQNNFAPLERLEEAAGYGVQLAKRKRLKLGEHSWRFWTRYPNDVSTAFPEDPNTAWNQTIIAGEKPAKTLQEWIKSLGFSAHADPKINEALEMFSRPWRESGWTPPYWSHNELNREANPYYTLVLEWLKLNQLDTESLKCLGMYWDWKTQCPWNLSDQTGRNVSSRRISGQVLSAVLQKLDIPISIDTSSTQSWYLPVSPALPFLTALKLLLVEIGRDEPPVAIRLARHEGGPLDVFRLEIELSESHKGIRADPFGLLRKHRQQVQANRLSGVTQAYEDVLYCRTAGLTSKLNDLEWLKVFSEGTSFPCVGTIAEKYAFAVCWTGQPED